jgi:hypothetical protein
VKQRVRKGSDAAGISEGDGFPDFLLHAIVRVDIRDAWIRIIMSNLDATLSGGLGSL